MPELPAVERAGEPNFHVWVDAVTYLPLRETAIFGPPGQTTSSTSNDKYLPVTAANLAQLAPPVPAGFRRVTQRTYVPAPVPPGHLAPGQERRRS